MERKWIVNLTNFRAGLLFFFKFVPIAAFVFFVLGVVKDWPDQITRPFVLKLLFFLVFVVAFGFVAIRFALPLKTARLLGNTLIVGNFLTKIEVPLQNIEFVDGPDGTSLQRITNHLDHESRFGNRIVIVPGFLRATSVANYLRGVVDKPT